jgi:hypothetical protein
MSPRAKYTFHAVAWAIVGPIFFTRDTDLTGWACVLLALVWMASSAWASVHERAWPPAADNGSGWG